MREKWASYLETIRKGSSGVCVSDTSFFVLCVRVFYLADMFPFLRNEISSLSARLEGQAELLVCA